MSHILSSECRAAVGSYPLTIRCFIVIFAICAGNGSQLLAQTGYTVRQEEAIERKVSLPPNEGDRIQDISLNVQDSTLAYVLRRMARLANLRIVFDRDIPALNRRISVNIHQKPINSAFEDVLRGTGLRVVMTPSGNAVSIQVDSTAMNTRQQVNRIYGRIIDSVTKQGVPGATVEVVGHQMTQTSNANGNFTFVAVPVGSVKISVRLLGYRTREVPVSVDTGKAGTSITIAISQTSTTLSEVVTTATGPQRRVDVGSDIAIINADSLLRIAPVNSVTDLIAVARVPGVVVEPTSGLPGAPSRIRIRGIASIMGNNDPAVFVDGVRINARTSGASLVSAVNENIVLTSRLDDIDPETIEKIEVLRGPSAGALYGTDAASGVILITTKRGRAGPARWSFRAGNDWSMAPGVFPARYTGWGHSFGNLTPRECNIDNVLAGICVQDSVSMFNPESDPLLATQASGYKAGYSASVDGGTQQVRYNLTGSYSDQLGTTKSSRRDGIILSRLGIGLPEDFRRPDAMDNAVLSARLSLEPRQGHSIGLSMRYNQEARRMNRIASLSSSFNPRDTMYVGSPAMTRYSQRVNRLMIGGESQVNYRSWAHASASIGLDRSTTFETEGTSRYFACTISNGCNFPVRSRKEARGSETAFSFNTSGTLSGLIPEHFTRFLNVQPSIGLHITKFSSDQVRTLIDTADVDPNFGLWAGVGRATGDSTRSATAGAYTELRFMLFRRFSSSTGFRWDAGSAFGRLAGPKQYPELKTSWLISDESFFPRTIPVNTLRFRLAAGVSGNQPVLGAVDGGYMVQQAIVSGKTVRTIDATIVANPRLRPEHSFEYEYGLDAELFDQRIDARITIANKLSKNVIIAEGMPPSVLGGRVLRYGNISRVVNQSYEWSVDSRVFDQNSLLWTVRTSGSALRNRVARLGENTFDANYIGLEKGYLREGYPVAGRWARPALAYVDANGDGLLSPLELVQYDSLVYLGWGQPRYSLAYGTTLALFNRRISFSANLSQDVGVTQSLRENAYVIGLQDVNATLIEQSMARARGKNIATVQTMSILRLNSASVSINMPSSVAHMFRARAVALDLKGGNLKLWTRYRGRDPSVNSEVIGESRVDPGDLIPPPRTFATSVRIDL